MSSIFGGQVNPVPNANPIVGHDTQNQFLTALYGAGLGMQPGTSWGQAGFFQGVPGYTGPLSPTPQSTPVSSSTFNAFNPTVPTQNLYDTVRSMTPQVQQAQQTVSPMMSSIFSQGGFGVPGQMMQNIAQFGRPNPMMPFIMPYSSRGYA